MPAAIRTVFDESVWITLEETFSRQRMNFYLETANKAIENKLSDCTQAKELAFNLCCWNTELCQALYLPLLYLEVTLRNAMVPVLRRLHPTGWFKPENNAFKGTEAQRIQTASQRTKKKFSSVLTSPLRVGLLSNDPTEECNVIATLQFSFWVNVLSNNRKVKGLFKEIFATLDAEIFDDTLRELLFEHMPSEDRTNDAKIIEHILLRLARADKLRNYVAHYEPIFDLELDQLHTEICQNVFLISESASSLLEKRSAFLPQWRKEDGYLAMVKGLKSL